MPHCEIVVCVCVCLIISNNKLSFNSCPRNSTVGELSDKVVDNTLNNKAFMKYAEDKKSVLNGWAKSGLNNTSTSSSPGWHQVRFLPTAPNYACFSPRLEQIVLASLHGVIMDR